LPGCFNFAIVSRPTRIARYDTVRSHIAYETHICYDIWMGNSMFLFPLQSFLTCTVARLTCSLHSSPYFPSQPHGEACNSLPNNRRFLCKTPNRQCRTLPSARDTPCEFAIRNTFASPQRRKSQRLGCLGHYVIATEYGVCTTARRKHAQIMKEA
jgi:hypothetical protein